MVAKVGFDNNTDEVSFLKFLSESVPSIVVPRALGQVTLGSMPCLFLTRLPGETLSDVWPTLNASEKLDVQMALDRIFSELRMVELPSGLPL